VSRVALQVFAGPRARQHLRQHGLQPTDVRVVPAAAGGPKGLVLLPLDRFLLGQWLPQGNHCVHLLGASIGAWRMAAACHTDADAALAQLAEDYVTQTYPHEPGHMPRPEVVTEVLGQRLHARLGVCAGSILAHPNYRLHVFTSRGQGWLHRPGPVSLWAGWVAAWAANAVSRRALGLWMERVVFSDPRDALPLPLHDFPGQQVALTPHNLARAVLASCTIPFALAPVQDVPGGPAGTYWDGGITDYHLHLPYAAMAQGVVLYPHFSPRVVPGWLDKAWRSRHRPTPALDNLVLLAPHPDWVASLPHAKLPDRSDFKSYGEDIARRQRDWRRALGESQRLADEFAELVARRTPIDALPLA
jgi:hypothetical protein